MNFTNFEIRMFEFAAQEARKSDYYAAKLGCIMTYGHKIISRGHNSNKSHPLQKKYNRRYRNFNNSTGKYIHDSLHSEIDAITKIPYVIGKDIDWSKVKIFVYRISPGNELGYACAKPCEACMAMIKDCGIRHIYFTDNEGYSYLRLK